MATVNERDEKVSPFHRFMRVMNPIARGVSVASLIVVWTVLTVLLVESKLDILSRVISLTVIGWVFGWSICYVQDTDKKP